MSQPFENIFLALRTDLWQIEKVQSAIYLANCQFFNGIINSRGALITCQETQNGKAALLLAFTIRLANQPTSTLYFPTVLAAG